MDKMEKTDKIYGMADNLNHDLVAKLTNNLDMRKITDLSDGSNQPKNKRFIFKRLSFAASVAMFAAIFAIATGLAIAANMLVPRFFPGVGTIDVEPQAIRELVEPVYLENPETYSVALDYAAFIRGGNGSGTLLLEYTYVYGTVPRADLDRIFAGDIEPGEELSDEILSEAADYENERSRYRNFAYTVEPCGADEINDNLAVPEIFSRNYELKEKYNFEKMEVRPLGEMVENIEESEYYKLTFDNGQTAVIRLAPIGGEPAQSLWTNEDGGFKMRVTPYSLEDFRYGFEVFPTQDWSDTTAFSIQWLTTEVALGGDYESSLHTFANETKIPRIEWSRESDLPIIPEHAYKDLKGRELNGFNDFTFSYKGTFDDFLCNQANKGSWYRMLEEEGELEQYLQKQKEAGVEDRVYAKEDFWAKSVNAYNILVNAVFNESKAKRHKIKLPAGDGEIEPNQEIVVRGIKYVIGSVKREGDKVEINYAFEKNNARESIGGNFKVDGYESRIEYKNLRTDNQHPALVVEGVGKQAKSLDIYLHYAQFFQHGSWSVDLSHLAD
jgi:hypothetical protein